MKRPTSALASLVLGALAATLLAGPGQAAGPGSATTGERADRRVVTREISFDVANRNSTSVLCLPGPDNRSHVVRAKLIGPAQVLQGHGGVETFHVLVHDAGTGGWFWNLHGEGVPASQDYATELARQGETVVVLDRLGYDRSPLSSGATCLGAQATMLSRVVQALYAGVYTMPGAGASVPHASHVVLHGHGTGATIARLESTTYKDVQALVLMSPATSNPSSLALQAVRTQGSTCLGGARSAPYGASNADFRRLLFASATSAVQKAASRLRNPTPCGDVASTAAAVLTADSHPVEVPTLVLTGSKDVRGGDTVKAASGTRLVRRSYAGAGSALPLEKQAPAVRRTVLTFVRGLDDRDQ
jgi:pimeloyl-ACP methyl ester carboxylesterase